MQRFHIPDMHCGSCAGRITAAVRALDASAGVTVDIPARTIEVVCGAAAAEVERAIRDAGYAPTATP